VACIRCSGTSRKRQPANQGLTSEDETTQQRPTSQDEQSRADEKTSQGLTRRDAFNGQRVVACTPADIKIGVPLGCTFSFFIETCGYVCLQGRDL